jgi:hypothetical protein
MPLAESATLALSVAMSVSKAKRTLEERVII